MKIFILVIIFLQSLKLYSQSLNTHDVLYSLDSLQQIFKYKYAPVQLKADAFSWNYKEDIKNAKSFLQNQKQINRYQFNKQFTSVLYKANDYHVDVELLTDKSSTLPLTFKAAETSNRYFVAFLDETKIDITNSNINIGDELIAFDGKKPQDIIEHIKSQYFSGTPLTDKLFSTMLLTKRNSQFSLDVPTGVVDLILKDKNTGLNKSSQFVWNHKPETIHLNQHLTAPQTLFYNRSTTSNFNFHKKAFLPFWKKIKLIQSESTEEDEKNNYPYNKNLHEIGGKKSFVPELGKPLWQTKKNNPFYAYIFEYRNKKYGFLRIPHYEHSDNEFLEFKKIIEYFQNFTDGLVIDQVNNPGGSVFYLYALVSTLINEPVPAPRHKIVLSPDNISEAVALKEQLSKVSNLDQLHQAVGETWDGYPVDMQSKFYMQEYSRFLINENSLGKKLSDPIFLYQADKIQPNKSVNYTKPILLLINSLDFSGGDFLPAILKDSQRAQLLGSRTAGAGGYVEEFSFPNHIGISKIYITGSIAYRQNKQPIETLGVKPDIEYLIDAKDLQSNYDFYKQKILNSIHSML